MTLQEAIQQRDNVRNYFELVAARSKSKGKKFREAEEELNFWQGKVAFFESYERAEAQGKRYLRTGNINSFK